MFVSFEDTVFLCSSYSVLDSDFSVHIALRVNHHTWLMRCQGTLEVSGPSLARTRNTAAGPGNLTGVAGQKELCTLEQQ
jgi:hypothetical protein